MKVIARFVLTRRGLRLWQEEIAQMSREGWELREHQVYPGPFGLRWLLVATYAEPVTRPTAFQPHIPGAMP